MTNSSTKLPVLGSDAEIGVGLLNEWFDPIEACLRDRVRELIQTMIESELEAVLSRPRYARRPKADPENYGGCGVAGHRHGHRSRSLLGTFGRVEIAVPRARLDTSEGKTTEWKSKALRAYQRRTNQADSLIAGAYLAGTNTRRVRRARAAPAGVPDCRWRDWAGAGSGRSVGRCTDPTLHRPQASQSARPRAPAAARRGFGRLQRHDLRRLAGRNRTAPPGLPSQMATQMQGGRRQPRGGR